jgi:hypothetical protein
MKAVAAGSLLVVLLPLLQLSCGGGSQVFDAGDPGLVDAQGSQNDAGDDDAGDDASSDTGPPIPPGACNTLLPGDLFVQPTDNGTTAVPTAQGGTLVAGIYHLASTTYYPARFCARDPAATTLVIDAASPLSGTLELAAGIAGGSPFTESIRYATDSGGTLLSTRIGCFSDDPGGVQGSAAIIPYTATATSVVLFTNSPTCGFSVDSYQM